jgi:hypothetical protein
MQLPHKPLSYNKVPMVSFKQMGAIAPLLVAKKQN